MNIEKFNSSGEGYVSLVLSIGETNPIAVLAALEANLNNLLPGDLQGTQYVTRAVEQVTNNQQELELQVGDVDPSDGAEIVEDEGVNLENLDVKDLKALADERGLEYPKAARKSGMLKVLNGGEVNVDKMKNNQETAEKQPENNLDLDTVKSRLKEVCKTRGLKVGQSIVTDHGVAKSDQLDPADYASVMNACDKVLS